MTEQEIESLAEKLAGKLTREPEFRRLVREWILYLAVEQAESQARCAVDTFFQLCEGRDIRLSMNEAGKVMINSRANMGADLRSVYAIYRLHIDARLREVRDREKAAQQREAEEQRLYEIRMNGHLHKGK
jgi:hypothetical protein